MPTKKDKQLSDQIDMIRERIVKDMYEYNRLIREKKGGTSCSQHDAIDGDHDIHEVLCSLTAACGTHDN